MFRLARVAIEVAYSTANIFTDVPYVAYTVLLFVGGVCVWYLFIALLEWIFLRKERASQVIYTGTGGKKGWKRRPRRDCRNVKHLTLTILLFGGIVMVIWIACASAGFNPWTTAAASLSISVVLTYTFAATLPSLGAGLTLDITNSIQVGQYWEFQGPTGWDGLIISINRTEVEMERWDETTGSGELVVVPISAFLQEKRKRNWKREEDARHHRTCVNDDECKAILGEPDTTPHPQVMGKKTFRVPLPYLPTLGQVRGGERGERERGERERGGSPSEFRKKYAVHMV
jgi:hypothetical protein